MDMLPEISQKICCWWRWIYSIHPCVLLGVAVASPKWGSWLFGCLVVCLFGWLVPSVESPLAHWSPSWCWQLNSRRMKSIDQADSAVAFASCRCTQWGNQKKPMEIDTLELVVSCWTQVKAQDAFGQQINLRKHPSLSQILRKFWKFWGSLRPTESGLNYRSIWRGTSHGNPGTSGW